MSPFQAILLLVIAGLSIVTIAGRMRGRLTRFTAAALACVWIAGASLAIWPELSTDVARAIGIGRGADVVLYVALMISVVGFFLVHLQLCRLQGRISELVRQLALLTEESPRQPERRIDIPRAAGPDESAAGGGT